MQQTLKNISILHLRFKKKIWKTTNLIIGSDVDEVTIFELFVPVLTIRFQESAAGEFQEVHKVLTNTSVKGADVIVFLVLLKMGVPATIHPLVGRHGQPRDLV